MLNGRLRPLASDSAPLARKLTLEPLEPRRLLAVDFNLLKDIYGGPTSAGAGPNEIVEVGSIAFFTASTPGTGRELWKSDGTEAGTVRVKDIIAGAGSSYPESLTNVEGTLYFGANDGAGSRSLWKSDGTEAGTTRIKTYGNGPFVGVHYLTNVGGVLYFAANDGVSGHELWKSNGSEAGTVRVADIIAGGSGSNPLYLTNVGGTLYFSAIDATAGREL